MRIAEGVVLAAGARVTTNVSLERHTQLNVGAVVSHDCEVGAFVTLSPGTFVNGECTDRRPRLLRHRGDRYAGPEVGADTKVGAGAVVLEDVPMGRLS